MCGSVGVGDGERGEVVVEKVVRSICCLSIIFDVPAAPPMERNCTKNGVVCAPFGRLRQAVWGKLPHPARHG